MPTKESINQTKYDAANTTRVGLKLNNKKDADILSKLKKEKAAGGIQAYIKRLIRQDLKREE